MTARAIFAISAALCLVSSAVAAKLYVWPWLRAKEQDQAQVGLVAPHMFLRFIGLSFLVVGVVAPSLPPSFAIPAAYGDLIAGILAVIAVVALSQCARWARGAVWVFNVWGATDLLFAFYQGPHVRLHPEALGSAFYIPTAIVPPLLVTHFLVFQIPFRKHAN
jgi:hypothetical protein